MSESDEELKNLLGQYLVASYQADKLMEMIIQRLSYADEKKIKFALTGEKTFVVTIKVEKAKVSSIEP